MLFGWDRIHTLVDLDCCSKKVRDVVEENNSEIMSLDEILNKLVKEMIKLVVCLAVLCQIGKLVVLNKMEKERMKANL